MLSHFGLLHFSGPDAQTFLQGQLSCDVAALQPLHATYGSYNTPKGRMLIRSICMVFDRFLREAHAEPVRYSRTI